MKHPTDEQLVIWLRAKKDVDHDDAVRISEHLETCHSCKERLERLKAYYRDLEEEIGKPPGRKERSLASKITQRRTKRALPSGSLLQTYEAPLEEHRSSLPVQIKNYLQDHPAGSASITIGTIFLATLLFIVQPWQGSNHNPTYAEVERNVLHVYDQQGESLWNMVVDGIPNGTNSEIEATRSSKRFIRITDIDGDGTSEVILTGAGYQDDITAGMLYCYNNDGTLRWKQSPPPPITFGDRAHSSEINWDILDFFVYNPSESNSRLFVTSNSSWFPSVLFELDTSNGEILQSYWHPGWIWDSEIYKGDDVRNDKLILGATNNAYQKAALIVLNPTNINGYAPVKESYQPKIGSRADEDTYIMFKPSTLNEQFGTQLYNEISWLRITGEGGLNVRTEENLSVSEKPASVLYSLDKNFTVLEARGVARYQRFYSDLYNDGKLEQPFTDEYWETLKDSVLYWDETAESFIRQGEREE
jgi:hypothetical protein